MKMIELHTDRPAPTIDDVMAWTGLPRRAVRPFLARLAADGWLLMEEKGRPPGRSFRFRCPDNPIGTGWTVRKRRTRV